MWIIVVLLALVAPARADATWDQVAALAKPTAKRGSAKQLAAAIAIAEKRDTEWTDAHMGAAQGYPDGPAAMTALTAWRKDHGGLTPAAPPLERNGRAFAMMRLGQMAIATADVEHRANLEVVAYLAATMIEDGDNFLVVEAGVSLIADANEKASKLVVSTDKWPAAHPELVRIVAAEALSQKAAGEPSAPFFLKGLDGAKRDEPPDATVARVHAAAGADRAGQIVEKMVIRVRRDL